MREREACSLIFLAVLFSILLDARINAVWDLRPEWSELNLSWTEDDNGKGGDSK